MGCASSWPLIFNGYISQWFFYVSLVHSTISTNFRTHLCGKSEAFSTSTISNRFFTVPCFLWPELFLCFSIYLILFSPFIMIIWWMVHLNSINFPFYLVIGAPIPTILTYLLVILICLQYGYKSTITTANITMNEIYNFILNCHNLTIKYQKIW